MHTNRDSNGRLRPRVIWAIVVVWVVGLLVVGGVAATVVVVKPCGSCHSEGLREATARSTHAAIDCRDCHLSAGPAARTAYAIQHPVRAYMPVNRTSDRDAAAVPDSRCMVCHQNVMKRATSSNGIRVQHAYCAQGSACTDCHSTVAHGTATKWVRAYDMDRCIECHAKAANVACNLCHKGRHESDRVKSASFSVTHGPNWKATHGMGDVATCTVCHKPADCEKCHGPGVPHVAEFVKVHADLAKGAKARCSTCHAKSFCNDCHGTEMPHTSKFTRSHAAASRSDSALCERCHAESDCKGCHLKHVHPGGAIKASTGGGTL